MQASISPILYLYSYSKQTCVQHHALRTTKSNDLLWIETKHFSASYPMNSSGQCRKRCFITKTLFIKVGNFTPKVVRIPERMDIARIVEPLAVVWFIYFELRSGSGLGTPEKDKQTHPIPEKRETSGSPIWGDVSTVHYKPTKKSRIPNDATLYRPNQ